MPKDSSETMNSTGRAVSSRPAAYFNTRDQARLMPHMRGMRYGL
jgi:hypothetical protein